MLNKLIAREEHPDPARDHVHVGSSPAFNRRLPAFVTEYPIASLDGGTVRGIPSTNIVTELFPRVIVKCFEWNVGVLVPGCSSSPGINLLPVSSLIRHTYTAALGRSDSATTREVPVGRVACPFVRPCV